MKLEFNDIKILLVKLNISQDQEIHAVPDLDSKIFHVLVLLFGKTNRVIIDTEIMNTLFIRTTRFIMN